MHSPYSGSRSDRNTKYVVSFKELALPWTFSLCIWSHWSTKAAPNVKVTSPLDAHECLVPPVSEMNYSYHSSRFVSVLVEFPDRLFLKTNHILEFDIKTDSTVDSPKTDCFWLRAFCMLLSVPVCSDVLFSSMHRLYIVKAQRLMSICCSQQESHHWWSCLLVLVTSVHFEFVLQSFCIAGLRVLWKYCSLFDLHGGPYAKCGIYKKSNDTTVVLRNLQESGCDTETVECNRKWSRNSLQLFLFSCISKTEITHRCMMSLFCLIFIYDMKSSSY